MRGLSIAVAGCGPCGLAAATMLARAGHEVTILERFEVPQPVGSGLMLQPTGLAVLDRLGLADKALAAGARIDRLHGRSQERVVLDVSYRSLKQPDLFGIGIHRSTLFVLLETAAREAGVQFVTGREIAGSAMAGAKRRLIFADGGQSAGFDLVVDALGSRSSLAPRVGRALPYGALWASLRTEDGDGFDTAALEQRYYRASQMVGVMPMGKGLSGTGSGSEDQVAFFWSLRADQYPRWRQVGLAAWKEQVLALWPACAPLLSRIGDPAQLTFARYSHRTLKRNVAEAMIHLGDAWHSASPQLGQGANMALLDAYSLSCALSDSSSLPEALREARRQREDHVQLYQWLTAMFTPVYQSDGAAIPWLRDRIIGPVSRLRLVNRIQARMVSGLFGSPLARLGLEPPLLADKGA